MKKNAYTYMEDCAVGQKFFSGPVMITEKDIVAYAKQFDPQDFHTDPVKAKETFFGELVASGWHTASLAMRLTLEAVPPIEGGFAGRSVLNMQWPRPVKPGDQMSYEGEILEMRVSNSNPKRGIMKVKNTLRNQNKEAVLEMETIVFIPRRGGG